MIKRKTNGKFPVTQILGVVAGSVAAGMVGKLILKVMPTASATVQALVPVAAGVFLAMQKNEIIKGAGFGMVAAGGSALVDAFMPPTVGANDVDEYFMSEYDDYLSEPADQSILSSPMDQSILSAYDDNDGMFGDEEIMMNAYDGEQFEN